MIPLKDENPTSRIPFLTMSFIILNSITYLYQFFSPVDALDAAYAYGAIPVNLLSLNPGQAVHPLLTIISSMFMHGGLLHLATNMLYLWIFGNNIEDQLGYGRFLLFYLMCGSAAAYAHSLANPLSEIPMIGASGAVSGVLGAYMVIFPQARVHTLVFLGFYIQVVRLPALLVILLWVIIQVVNGIISHGLAAHGGVAWFAHVGGFISGIIIIKYILKVRVKRPYR